MQRAKRSKTKNNFDGIYLLKLVLYLLLGSVWLKVSNQESLSIYFPIGLFIGLVFTAHEHFQIDRKIEYAILLAATLIGFVTPFGLYIDF